MKHRTLNDPGYRKDFLLNDGNYSFINNSKGIHNFNNNERISSDWQNIERERDELSRRLQISLKKNSELESQIKSIIDGKNAFYLNKCKEQEDYINEKDFKYRNEILSLTKTIEKQNEQIQSFDAVINSYENQINSILQAASCYFATSLLDVTSLLCSLKYPKTEIREIDSNQHYLSTKHNNKWKLLYFKDHEKHKEIETSLIQRIDYLINENHNNVESINGKMQDLSKTINDKDIIIERLQTELLEARSRLNVMNVKDQIDLRNQLLQKNEDILRKDQQIKLLTTQLNNKEDTITTTHQQICHIKHKYFNLKSQHSQISSDNNQLNNRISSLLVINENISKEIANFKINYAELDQKYTESLKENEILHFNNNNNLKSLKNTEIEIDKIRTLYDHEKKLLEKYKNENERLNCSISDLKDQLLSTQNTLQEKDSIVKDLNDNIELLRVEINRSQKEIQILKDTIHENTLDDPFWAELIGIPSELYNIVERNIRDSNYPPKIKLQRLLSQIVTWMNNFRNKFEENNYSLSKQINEYDIIVQELIHQFSSIYPSLSQQLTHFMNSSEVRKNLYYNLKRDLSNKNPPDNNLDRIPILLDILQILGCDTPSIAIEKIQKLLQDHDHLFNKYERCKMKLQRKNMKTNHNYSIYQQRLESYIRENQTLKALHNQSNNQFKMSEASNHHVHSSIPHTENSQVLATIKEYSQQISDLQLQNLKHLEILNQEKEKNSHLETKIHSLQNQIDNLEKVNYILKISRHNKKKQLEKYQEITEHQIPKSNQNEDRYMITLLENQINTLQQKYYQIQANMHHLTLQNESISRTNDELIKKISQYEIQAQMLEDELSYERQQI